MNFGIRKVKLEKLKIHRIHHFKKSYTINLRFLLLDDSQNSILIPK